MSAARRQQGERLTAPCCRLLLLFSEPDSVCAVYEEQHQAVASIDEQEDLRWWRNTHGPGMPTDWPHFQVTPNHTAAAVAWWAGFKASKMNCLLLWATL